MMENSLPGSMLLSLTISEIVSIINLNKNRNAFVLYTFQGPVYSKYVHPAYNVLASAVPTLCLTDPINSTLDVNNNYFKCRYKRPISLTAYALNQTKYRKQDHVIVYNVENVQQKEYTKLKQHLLRVGWTVAMNTQEYYFWTIENLTIAGYQLRMITNISPKKYQELCLEYATKQLRIHPNFYLLLNSIHELNLTPAITNLTRSSIIYLTHDIPSTPSENIVGLTSFRNWILSVKELINKTPTRSPPVSWAIIIGSKGSGKSTCTSYFSDYLNLHLQSQRVKLFGRIDSDCYGKWVTELKNVNSLFVNFGTWDNLEEFQNDPTHISHFEIMMQNLVTKYNITCVGVDPILEENLIVEFSALAYTIFTDPDVGLHKFFEMVLDTSNLPLGIMIESHTNTEISRMPGTNIVLDLRPSYNCELALIARTASGSNLVQVSEILLYRAWERFHPQTYPSVHTGLFFSQIHYALEHII
ncbi:MAG: P6 [Corcyphos virus 3]|nr:MAG: P6 [Corcyphos virus 3]